MQVELRDASSGPMPYADGYFDAIMSLGMMDYLQYFDPVVREISRMTSTRGLLLVSLPNPGGWRNRLMLLLGSRPRDIEISSEVLAGVPQRPYRVRGESPAGHIHIPTVRAFEELMLRHGYETVQISRWSARGPRHGQSRAPVARPPRHQTANLGAAILLRRSQGP